MGTHFTLKNGQVFALAEAAGGVYNSEQIRRVVELADEESAFIKLTEDQRMGFMLSPERLEPVAASLGEVGLSLRPYRQQGMLAPKVCLGELCPMAQQDAMGDGVELSLALSENFGADVPLVTLGINGCEQGCCGSAVDDFHIVGEESGYKIAMGGRAREFPQLGQFLTENVQRSELAPLVVKLLKVFFDHREEGERLSDVMERLGTSLFLEVVEPASAEVHEDAGLDSADIETADVGLSEELALDDGTGESSLDAEEPLADEPADVVMESHAEVLLVEEDSLDVPLEPAGLGGGDADLGEVPLLDDVPLDDVPLDDEVKQILDEGESLEIDALDGQDVPSGTEVDVDEELRAVESRKATVRELNSEIDRDMSGSEADEELLIDDASQAEAELAPEDELIDEAGLDDVSLAAPFPDMGLQDAGSADGISLDDADLTLPCEEGTLEDVERMRDAIRSEVSPDDGGHSASATAPAVDLDLEEPMSIAPPPPPEPVKLPVSVAPPVEAPVAAKPPRKVMPRLKVKMGESEVRVTLPGGIECAVPFDWLESEGVFEMDVGEQTLSVERSGEMIHFRYGSLALSVPAVSAAA